MGLLGDSGMRMARAGFSWYFERRIAVDLIDRGIAVLVR
jgi:hypothetical protein